MQESQSEETFKGSTADPSRTSAGAVFPVKRWVGVAGLLLAEYLLISFMYDSQELLHIESFGVIMGRLGYVGPVILLAILSVFVFGGRPLQNEFLRASRTSLTARQVWPWLLLHGLAYMFLLWLTQRVFEISRVDPAASWLWAAAWMMTVLCVALSILPIAFPLGALFSLIRHGFLPIALSVLAGLVAWLSGLASGQLWASLGGPTIDLVTVLLGLFADDVVVDRASFIVGTRRFFVHLAPECSGFEGIGLLTAFLVTYLAVYRSQFRFPRVLLTLPLGIAAVWFLNTVRIVALVAVGAWWSPNVALSGFHSKAGWVLFCALALALIAWTKRSRFFARDVEQTRQATVNRTAAYLMPLLVVIATALVTGLATAGVDFLYPLRVCAAAITLWIYRSHYRPLVWTWSWEPFAIGISVFVLWIFLVDGSGGAAIRAGLATLPPWAAASWVSFRVLGAVITVPIVEELAFRGYLLRRFVSADFDQVPKHRYFWLAWILSSLAFGLFHQQLIAAAIAGMAYAIAQIRRGKTTDAIVAHAVTNALIAGDVLLFGRWGLW